LLLRCPLEVQRDAAKADALLSAAIAELPARRSYQLLAAEAKIELGDLEAAERLIASLQVEARSQNADDLLLNARFAASQKNFDVARQRLREAESWRQANRHGDFETRRQITDLQTKLSAAD
jgi:outer membrane PBP1 activator LpoA protein